MLVLSSLVLQFILVTFSTINVAEAGFQSIREKQYGKWANPLNITWMFESSFPMDSRNDVKRAADEVSLINAGKCIKFTQITAEPTDGTSFIVVTNRTKPNYRGENVKAKICDSNPGRWKLNNAKRNYLTIITSTDTGFFPCVGEKRVIMGLFFRTLGFFSELQRQERDTKVNFFTANLAPNVVEADTAEYGKQGRSEDGRFLVGDPTTPFDGESITIPPASYLSKSTKPSDGVFAEKEDSGVKIGNLNNNKPSRSDCLSVAKLYKRENNQCNFADCGA